MADRDDALAKIAHLRRRAYVPVATDGDGVATDSKFGGTPYLPSGTDWPACGVCERPMALLVQLNPSQFPESLRKEYGDRIIQLFYCLSQEPHCESDAEGWAPFSPVSHARAVDIAGDSVGAAQDAPGALPGKVIRSYRTIDDYPGWEERDQLGAELDDDDNDALDDATIPGDKLSGWPLWIQSIEYPSCPTCGKTMRLVFQIDSEHNLDYMWGDAGCAHLSACPVHKDQLAFGWACG